MHQCYTSTTHSETKMDFHGQVTILQGPFEADFLIIIFTKNGVKKKNVKKVFLTKSFFGL